MQNLGISVMSYYRVLTRIPQISHSYRPRHSGSGYIPWRSDRGCVDRRRRGISNTVVIVPPEKLMDMRQGKWESLSKCSSILHNVYQWEWETQHDLLIVSDTTLNQSNMHPMIRWVTHVLVARETMITIELTNVSLSNFRIKIEPPWSLTCGWFPSLRHPPSWPAQSG